MSTAEKTPADKLAEALAEWGMAKADPKLTLSSGVEITYRPLDIPKMVDLDILDKMDSFAPRVLDSGKKSKKKETEDPEMTAEKIVALVGVLDLVTVACVVSPEIHPEPEDGELVPGLRYVNKVSMTDKMEIFQAAFEGMEDLFRIGGEQEAPVGAVETLEGA